MFGNMRGTESIEVDEMSFKNGIDAEETEFWIITDVGADIDPQQQKGEPGSLLINGSKWSLKLAERERETIDRLTCC